MKTSAIISSNNIEGNIGSCAIQSNEVIAKKGIFTSEIKVTQINSCSGKIIYDGSYTDYGFVQFTIVIALVVLFFGALIAIGDNKFN